MNKTGRTYQLGTRVRKEFLEKLKRIAYEEELKLVEVLERALECYDERRGRAKNTDKKFSFPPEEELERITKYFADPNCKEINIGLTPNASELDKTKYEICQSISRYKRVNKLTPKELGKKIGINQEKTDDILFGRIGNFNLEELVSYTGKLNGHLKVNIDYDGELTRPAKQKTSARA
ncbi:3040_t:CDS:2 [Ambispora gerdemannii]|uniref:3040_t:CDS:1 n=1 Tax=Ambispora gerdemannii TaxID=144530 RepID=A0A9N9HFR1_9GLOM|nr:3040_t:CDS:2 [Ambispora gerdemannii]